jgi:MFS transporter, DHA1 family, multidrug resistance protein
MAAPARPLLSLLLTLLVGLAPVSTDLYLPSLPGIARDLATEASLVQLTLGLFIGGIALMQLVYGPLSDRFGRRPALFGGLGLYAVASLGCALAPTIGFLLAARVVQAIGAAAGPVIGRAVVRDIYGPRDAARILSYMASAMAIAPLLAPFVGGWLEVWLGWRASFWLLLIYAGLLGGMLWATLDETAPDPDPDGLRPGRLLSGYGMLLRSPLYVGFMLCGSSVFGALFGWISNASFVIIGRFGTPPEHFAWYFAITVAGYALGAFGGGRMGDRLGPMRTLGLGIGLICSGGLLLLALAWLVPAGLVALVCATALLFAGCGVVLPQVMGGALAPFPRIAGSAAALLGCVQMLTGMVSNALSGLLFDGTERPFATLAAAFAAAAVLAFLLVVRPRWDERVG